jgi:hypothetical protein
MCLTIKINYQKIPARLEFTDEKKTHFYAYKALTRNYNGAIVSPYRHKKFTKGYNKSNRAKIELASDEEVSTCRNYGVVRRGIHVFLNKQGASKLYCGTLYVKVKCALKDVVAFGAYGGAKSAVLMKVFISKQEWDKAI